MGTACDNQFNVQVHHWQVCVIATNAHKGLNYKKKRQPWFCSSGRRSTTGCARPKPESGRVVHW
jgi:hypothetical protein